VNFIGVAGFKQTHAQLEKEVFVVKGHASEMYCIPVCGPTREHAQLDMPATRVVHLRIMAQVSAILVTAPAEDLSQMADPVLDLRRVQKLCALCHHQVRTPGSDRA